MCKVDKYRVKVFYVDSILEWNVLIFVLKEFGYIGKKCKDRDYVMLLGVKFKFIEVVELKFVLKGKGLGFFDVWGSDEVGKVKKVVKREIIFVFVVEVDLFGCLYNLLFYDY